MGESSVEGERGSMELTLDYLKSLNLKLGPLISLRKISGGYSNNNYLLTAGLGRYRIRVPKYSVSLKQLQAEQQVINWAAAKSKFPVPIINTFIMEDNTPISVLPYIEAVSTFDIHNEKLIYNAGRALSEYHLVVEGYKGPHPFNSLSSALKDQRYDAASIFNVLKSEQDISNPEFYISVERLYERIKNASCKVSQEDYVSLPFVSCHGDYAPANLLSLKDEVIGVLDFECARWAPRIYDVAIALLALEQSEGYEVKMSACFLKGYESNIKLLQRELELISEFQCIRTLESANRHFNRLINGNEKINTGLIMYWSTII
jgi:Ser/Thr protein kinase RdoA (MazF antagonist)